MSVCWVTVLLCIPKFCSPYDNPFRPYDYPFQLFFNSILLHTTWDKCLISPGKEEQRHFSQFPRNNWVSFNLFCCLLAFANLLKHLVCTTHLQFIKGVELSWFESLISNYKVLELLQYLFQRVLHFFFLQKKHTKQTHFQFLFPLARSFRRRLVKEPIWSYMYIYG